MCPDFQSIFQYMAISGNENLLNCIQNCAKIGPKLCQILNLPSKNCQRLVRFCQSGQFWPNLVSLLLILLWEVKGNKNCFAIILLFCFLGSASSSPAAATRDSWKVIKIWSWSSFIATKFSISFFDVPISYNTYYYTYCTYCYTYNAYYYTYYTYPIILVMKSNLDTKSPLYWSDNTFIITRSPFQTNLKVGNGCGKVGRVVTSDSIEPRFESGHRKLLLNKFSVNCLWKLRNSKEKEAVNGPFKKHI